MKRGSSSQYVRIYCIPYPSREGTKYISRLKGLKSHAPKKPVSFCSLDTGRQPFLYRVRQSISQAWWTIQSGANAQLDYSSVKAAIDNMQTKMCDCVPIKLYLKIQLVNHVCQSLPMNFTSLSLLFYARPTNRSNNIACRRLGPNPSPASSDSESLYKWFKLYYSSWCIGGKVA